MSKITRRKAIIQSAGIALSLPFLPSLYSNEPKIVEKPPTRSCFIYYDLGTIQEDYLPTKDKPISKTLEPIKEHLGDILILGGLSQNAANANGNGGGDHGRSSGTFLTGTTLIKTSGKDIRAATSIDQVIAQKIGAYTKLPSVELSIDGGSGAGDCDSGYSCPYSNNISWRSPTTPNAKEVNPRNAFIRLFSNNNSVQSLQVQNKIDAENKSLLDLLNDDAKSLKNKLGGTDNRKLDEYLDSVRSLESRIQSLSDIDNHDDNKKYSMNIPNGVPSNWAEHANLMYDILALAFQTDTTRVSSFMLNNGGSGRIYKEIGITDNHHEISHFGTDKTKMDKITKINQYHLEAFNRFLTKLKSIKEGSGTLLDNCMIVYGSGIENSNKHNHNNLPILLAGKGSGSIVSGRYIPQCKGNLNDLYIALANRMSVPIDTFGDDGHKTLSDLQ